MLFCSTHRANCLKFKKMETIKRNIPNFITCLNLTSGFWGISAVLHHQGEMAIFFVLLALVFDFFDGLIARWLKVTSPTGRDLDSLADMVTFGILPGLMMYEMLDFSWQFSQPDSSLLPTYTFKHNLIFIIPSLSIFAILIPVFSAIRLARFNNDKEQSYHFKGLPTPVAGILITSLYFYFVKHKSILIKIRSETASDLEYLYSDFGMSIGRSLKSIVFDHPWTLITVSVSISVLLVCNLKLMAFKFKDFSWKANRWKYILLILSMPLIIFLGFASAPIILILYIILSQIHFRTNAHEI